MALVTTPQTAIGSTTNQTASGTANLGAIANKFAVQVVHSGQIGKPTLNVYASCDNINFTRADPNPQPQLGEWISYGTPAQYIQVSIGGNNGTAEVLVMPQTD
jgi:hypothetical protein